MISREQRLPVAIASLALFVALGGTSYAAVKLQKGSVTSREVKDGSLRAADLAAGVAAAGPAGPRGPRGAEGPQGPQGLQGISQAYVSRSSATTLLPTGPERLVAGSLRLPAGSYRVDFATHIYTAGSGTYGDCALEAAGKVLNKSAVKVGASAGAAVEQSLVISDVITFAQATTVTANCWQRTTSQDVRLDDARLIAMRIGAIETQ
jgi:hypothetical protein